MSRDNRGKKLQAKKNPFHLLRVENLQMQGATYAVCVLNVQEGAGPTGCMIRYKER